MHEARGGKKGGEKKGGKKKKSTKALKFQLWYGVGCMLTQLNDPHFKSLTYHNPKCKHDKNAGNTHTPHP